MEYCVVIIKNEENGRFNAFAPDLAIFAEGASVETALAEVSERIKQFITICKDISAEIPQPTPKEQIEQKWQGFALEKVVVQ